MKRIIVLVGIVLVGFGLAGCSAADETALDKSDANLSSDVKDVGIVKEKDTKASIAKILDTKVDDTDGQTVQKTFDLAFIDQDSFTSSTAFKSQDVIGVVKDNEIATIKVPYDSDGETPSSMTVSQTVSSDPNYQPTVTLVQKDSTYNIMVIRPVYTTYNQAPIDGTVTEKSENN